MKLKTINRILEHSHDIPQICLRNLLNNISYNNITEIWEVSYIASRTSKSHYVVILKDATLRWFNLSSDPPTNLTGFITIVNGKRNHTTIPLSYMNQLRTDNIYTPTIRENVDKKNSIWCRDVHKLKRAFKSPLRKMLQLN